MENWHKKAKKSSGHGAHRKVNKTDMGKFKGHAQKKLLTEKEKDQ